MECVKEKMSITPPKGFISSPTNSLGAGDTSFQAIVGYQTQKLSSSTSPIQIFRQRYWCKSPYRKPLTCFQIPEVEKTHKLQKNIKSTIHASLEDLREKSSNFVGYGRKSTSKILNEMENYHSKNISQRERHQAARRIYEALMLNAWRKRKEDASGLIKMIQYLHAELDKQKMHLHVIKSILKNETEKNEKAMAEISFLNSKLQEQIRITETIGKEKQESDRAILNLEDKLSNEITLKINAVNELIQSRNEQDALEAQLNKEREKLIKLREEMLVATNKVTLLEENISAKNNCIEHMRQINQKQMEKLVALERRMAEELAAERTRYDELRAERTALLSTISVLEEDKKRLQNEIEVKVEEEKLKELKIAALEKEIKRKEKRHDTEMKHAMELLSDTLNERRQLELIDSRRDLNLKLMGMHFFSEIARLPLILFNSLSYVVWPQSRNNQQHSNVQ